MMAWGSNRGELRNRNRKNLRFKNGRRCWRQTQRHGKKRRHDDIDMINTQRNIYSP